MIRRSHVVFGLTLGMALAVCQQAWAVKLYYTETFQADDANWGDSTATSTVFVAPGYHADGGPTGDGDGYISTEKTFSSSPNAQLLFRGQANFDSSDDKFVGNWLAKGVTELRYWVRHHAEAPLKMGARFAVSANSPAGAIVFQELIPADTWVRIDIPISNVDTPKYDYTQENGTFNGVFSALANVQILALGPASGAEVLFDLDNVQVVPEPSSLVLGGLGACLTLALAWRRRRAAA